jgi:hypothetical protein
LLLFKPLLGLYLVSSDIEVRLHNLKCCIHLGATDSKYVSAALDIESADYHPFRKRTIAVYDVESTFAAFNDPVELQKLPKETATGTWSDIKTVSTFAFDGDIVFLGQNSSWVMSDGSSIILADAQGTLFLCVEI